MNQMRISRKLATAAALAVAAALLAALGSPGVSRAAMLAGSSLVPNWTKQHPATRPSSRWAASMAYDAATGTVVLFGGDGSKRALGGTWTWGSS
jgi:hypothetical protein